jgi:membrane fusion protein (multidrug efflux system)
MSGEEKRARKGPSKGAVILVMLLSVGVIISLLLYRQYSKTHVSTDDAFVDGRIHPIAAKINGTVKTLHVTDNQAVKKGDLLIEIDPADYEVRVEEAGASLSSERSKMAETSGRLAVVRSQWREMAEQLEGARISLQVQRENLAQMELDINRAQANVDAQNARVRQAEQDIKRANDLFGKEAISREKHEKAQTARDVAVAQAKVAREQLGQAKVARDAQSGRVRQAQVEIRRIEAAIETQKNVIRQTEASLGSQKFLTKQKAAALRMAELTRSYTKIYAPVDGFVTKRSVEVGNQVQPGLPLMAVVPLEGTWITANYKETQLQRVRPGQKVLISVDTYPGKKFQGKVDSIMAGTGSAFSLFPPENATGNFVKVVQRIPVKIVLDEGTDPHHILRIGMSVVPTIYTQ